MFQGPPPGFPPTLPPPPGHPASVGSVGIHGPPPHPSLPGPSPSSSPSDRSPGRAGGGGMHPSHPLPSLNHHHQQQHPPSSSLALPAPPPSSAHHIVAERLAAAAAIASTSRRSPMNLSTTPASTSRSLVERGNGSEGNGIGSFLLSRASPGRRAQSSPSPSALTQGKSSIPGTGKARSDGSTNSSPSPTHHTKDLLESFRRNGRSFGGDASSFAMAVTMGHQVRKGKGF